MQVSKNQEFYPGPGYYSRTFDSNFSSVYKQTFNAIDNNIMQNAIFQSVTQRNVFKGHTEIPGPGAYAPKESHLKKKPEKKHVFAKAKSSVVFKEVPQTIDDIEDELLNTIFYDVQQVQKKIDHPIGPGDYNPNLNQVKSRARGAIIIKETSKIFKEPQVALVNHADKIFQYQHQQKQDYEQNVNEIKKEWIQRRKNMPIKYDNKIKQTEQFAVPDPGYYYDESRDTCFKAKFSITSAGFLQKQDRFHYTVKNTPEPYDIIDNNSKGFALDKQNRFKEQKNITPCPGTYENKLNIQCNLEKNVSQLNNKKTNAIFGSSLQRFPINNFQEFPGPGAYIKDKKRKKKRNVTQQIQIIHDIKQPEAFKEQIYNIQEHLQEEAIKKSNLRKKKIEQLGFLTIAKRFQDKKLQYNTEPGQYQTIKSPDLSKKCFNKFQTDFSRQQRQLDLRRGDTDHELGPGYYDLPQSRKLQ